MVSHVSSCVTCVTPPTSQIEAPRSLPEDALASWHSGVAVMQVMDPPLDFSATRWTRACLDAAALLEMHGLELLTMGWTATDVFGLHPKAPGAAVRCYGLALALDGGKVMKLTAEGAGIVRPSGAILQFRHGGGRPAVPAWALDGSSASRSAAESDSASGRKPTP